LPRRRVASANCSVVTAVRVVMAPRTSRGGPRWPDRSALVLLGVILAGVCLTGADSYAVLPVNHLTEKDFHAVPSTCDGVELTNPTFPAANASVVYKEFSPDSGASVCHIFTCLRLVVPLGFSNIARAPARGRASRASPRELLPRRRPGAAGRERASLPRRSRRAGSTPPGTPRRADRRPRCNNRRERQILNDRSFTYFRRSTTRRRDETKRRFVSRRKTSFSRAAPRSREDSLLPPSPFTFSFTKKPPDRSSLYRNTQRT
jgi:hypothetical protein